MRKAISLLESAQKIAGTDPLDVETLLEVATLLPTQVLESALTAVKSNSFTHIQEAATGIINQAYPVNQFLDQFAPIIVSDTTLTSVQKAHISIRLAQAEHTLIDHGDEYLQLLDVLGFTAQVIRGQVTA